VAAHVWVKYMHDVGVWHRDLKSLPTSTADETTSVIVKIADPSVRCAILYLPFTRV
jgi:hypothetical protein